MKIVFSLIIFALGFAMGKVATYGIWHSIALMFIYFVASVLFIWIAIGGLNKNTSKSEFETIQTIFTYWLVLTASVFAGFIK
jgi:hypothetical protein